MNAETVHPGNRDPDLQAAVELLVELHGVEAAEGRLLVALSAVRRRKIQEARG